MKLKLLFVLLIFSSFHALHAQQEGVKGQVFWIYGDKMPGPEKRSPMQGVVREIDVYELTTLADVDQGNGFFKKIYTRFVTSTTSAEDGTFKIKLPPGKYSLFVKEENGFYANLFDSDKNICLITVKPKQYAWMTITIDYEATYGQE
jgi:hypothetical protein